ncbi:MAG: ABC transporter substrate-binding protein [Actinomycetia bacterium]|nr:ABC transporter substrate-binding protein [Actinomycetes bacterium]
MRKFRIFALLLVLALVAAACSSDSDETTTTAGAEETTTTAAAEETTTTAAAEETTTTAAAPAELKTDFGVDVEAGTITVGQTADLTGPFAPLVTPILAGQKLYWGWVNANGGIGGMEVLMETRDTAYQVEQHIAAYDEIRDKVVAISHTTGSPQTLAIADALEEDDMIAVPATWYSGWTDTNIAPTVLHLGAPYCLEAMSLLDWVSEEWAKEGNEAPTLAVASIPGDFGLDSMAGALKWAEINGVEVVYDGSATIIPNQDQKPVADAIVASGANMVYVTTTPGTFGEVFGAALQQGFVGAKWSGAGPTYNPAFIAEGSAIADAIQAMWYGGFYAQPWGGDSAGMALTMQLVEEFAPDMPANDYVGLGVSEAMLVHAALQAAYDSGDMTRAGVNAALRTLDNVDFMGLAPNENYTGSTSDQVQRAITLYRPSVANLEAGGSGSEIVANDFVGPTALGFDFQEACYQF